ncbi:MAG TPA: DUF885 domain-containing protein [Sphingobacteriaceae bacterium]|nr:DUF885 domain-containing protein [Sphingobacteriaceae bacterium]
MIKLIKSLKTSVFLFLLASSTLAFAQKNIRNAAFNSLLDNYYEETLKLNPLSATQRGDDRYNDLLPNTISAPYLKIVHDMQIKYQSRLAAFKRESLSSFDKISFDMMSLEIKQALEREKFHGEYIPFSQYTGLPVTLPSFGSGKGIQPFKTVTDYYNWLKRIDVFTSFSDTAIANFNKGIAIGMILPQALVIKMIPQMEAHAVTDTNKNIFYGPVKDFPASFTETEKSAIRLAYQNAISTKIIPGYKKLADYLKNVYLPKSLNTSGINFLPNGDAMYQHAVGVYTATNKKPEEIYQTGLKEVNRITKAITLLKDKTGFRGTTDSLFRFMKMDKRFFPFKDDEQILNSYRSISSRIQPNLRKLFNIVPKAAFEVKSIEKFKVATSAANYQRGSEDGSRPGYFNVPIVNAEKYSILNLENLFLHEAIPGHHYQLSLQQENQLLPKLRKFATYSVFSEGWALYAESLGSELGLYTDPYQQISALSSELFRAVRLVVDVSLHTGRMTREEAIKYMVETAGLDTQRATSETERYMANPAQALSYKTGELKIKEMKMNYQKMLGKKFDTKSFHDAILLGGSMPLNVFETYMNEWVTRNK